MYGLSNNQNMFERGKIVEYVFKYGNNDMIMIMT